MIACIGSGPANASYSRRPATVAAALLPSPARMGISLCTSTDERWEASAVLARQKTERPLNIVFAAKVLAYKAKFQLAVSRDGSHAQAQIQLHRDGERVEAWPQVGDRCRNLDLERLRARLCSGYLQRSCLQLSLQRAFNLL